MTKVGFAFLLIAVSAWGQSFTASVLGNVTDSSGAGVPNALIVATNVATNTKDRKSVV